MKLRSAFNASKKQCRAIVALQNEYVRLFYRFL